MAQNDTLVSSCLCGRNYILTISIISNGVNGFNEGNIEHLFYLQYNNINWFC